MHMLFSFVRENGFNRCMVSDSTGHERVLCNKYVLWKYTKHFGDENVILLLLNGYLMIVVAIV